MRMGGALHIVVIDPVGFFTSSCAVHALPLLPVHLI